jgi:hypothetical protein
MGYSDCGAPQIAARTFDAGGDARAFGQPLDLVRRGCSGARLALVTGDPSSEEYHGMSVHGLSFARSRRGVRGVLAIIATLIVATVTVGFARQSALSTPCNNQTIAGTYGFRTSGQQKDANGNWVPFSSIGTYVRDDQGNIVAGDVTSNAGGTLLHSPLTGTYTVNPDCTGSQTTTLNTGVMVSQDFVVVSGGQQLEFVFTGSTGAVGGTQTRQ